MEILSKPIYDGRIDAYNVMTQMTLKEYFELVKDSMDKNDLQRAKVPSSKNIYSLLKEDLVMGCYTSYCSVDILCFRFEQE